MNKTLRRRRNIGVLGFCTGLTIYAGAFLSLNIIQEHKIRNNKIKPTELEAVLEQEKEKLNFDAEISVVIDDTLQAYAQTDCSQDLEHKYVMRIRPEVLSPVVIRHELYHLVKGDCKDRMPPFTYQFRGKKYRVAFKNILIEEPRAELYAVTGIKF